MTLEVERRQKHGIVDTFHNLSFFKTSIRSMLNANTRDWSKKKCFVLFFKATVQIQAKGISYAGIVASFQRITVN